MVRKDLSRRGEIYFDPIKCLLYRVGRALSVQRAEQPPLPLASSKTQSYEIEKIRHYIRCKFTDLINSSLTVEST